MGKEGKDRGRSDTSRKKNEAAINGIAEDEEGKGNPMARCGLTESHGNGTREIKSSETSKVERENRVEAKGTRGT